MWSYNLLILSWLDNMWKNSNVWYMETKHSIFLKLEVWKKKIYIFKEPKELEVEGMVQKLCVDLWLIQNFSTNC